MSENTGQLDDLIHLLGALSKEDLAAVRALVERLTRREMAVKEATAPYYTPVGTAEEPVSRMLPPKGSREALLECIGIWEFEPGELDEILASIEQVRMMELEYDGLSA